MRQGPWKFVQAKEVHLRIQETHADAVSGLYNVQADPGETNNLMAQHPDIARHLEEQLATIRSGRPAEAAERRQAERDPGNTP